MIDRRSVLGALTAPGFARAASAPPTDLIGDVALRTFRFFWETTDPRTGLAPDRWPTRSFSSIAAVGFALSAYPIGVARGWITRAQARTRTLRTLATFAQAPQGPQADAAGYKGFFYHFLDMRTQRRFGRCELSTIDTTLLLGGVLFAQSWFDADHPDERAIRDLAEQLYRAVDWSWAVRRAPFVSMGWTPEHGFIADDWNRYCECHLLYLLALASPTHPLPRETWDAWTATFDKAWTTTPQPHIGFAPLFGHQYSYCWVDFRGVRDRFMRAHGLDYFENSRRAAYAQRAYAIANPQGFTGYGADMWGLTACDGPGDFSLDVAGRRRSFYGYAARGPGERDDGTLAPTAALGSIAFAPEIVAPAAAAMHARYGRAIYGRYGFIDSFNPTLTGTRPPLQAGRMTREAGWVDGDWLGIDQGPILMMIENHRSGLVWAALRRSPHIRRGLERAGFTGGWLAA